MAYVCKICGKEFTRPSAMGGHVARVHSPNARELQRAASKAQWVGASESKKREAADRLAQGRSKHLEGVVLTEKQRQLILGSLMGDMSILYPNSKSRYPRVTVRQSSVQADYVRWKYSLLKNLVGSPPRFEKNAGWGSENVAFSTRSLPCLIPIYDLVKIGKETRFSDAWLSEVNSSIALAAWYMDDGTLSPNKNRDYQKVYGHTIRVSLGDSTRGEMECVVRWMDRVWGISVHGNIYQKKASNRRPEASVSIHKSADIDAFLDIVRPHVVPCLKYKVTRDYTYTT